MTRTEEQVRADIVEIGRRLWVRGYVAANDGNISVRIGERHMITTPKNVSKGFMTPDMMVVTDLDGRKVAGERDPSSEIKMHLQVYRDRPDARHDLLELRRLVRRGLSRLLLLFGGDLFGARVLRMSGSRRTSGQHQGENCGGKNTRGSQVHPHRVTVYRVQCGRCHRPVRAAATTGFVSVPMLPIVQTETSPAFM